MARQNLHLNWEKPKLRVFFCSHVTLLTCGCLALIRYGFLGKGLTGVGLFYSLSLMRPCDGTSGLVRGNRRKAVFAFKGLFALGRLSRFSLSDARFYRVFSEVRGKSETSEHNPIFGNKTAGHGSVKPGSGRPISVFPALPETPAGSMRQILGLQSTRPFLHKETAGRGVTVFRCARHVLNLPHTSDFCPCGRPCSCKASAR